MSTSVAAQVLRGGRMPGEGPGGTLTADILLIGGVIGEIGPPGMAVSEDAVVIDATDRLILPGLINAHTHGDATLAKGIGDRWTLELLLSAGPLSGAGIDTPEAIYLAAKLGAVEMVEKGATAAFDLFSLLPGLSREGLHAVAQAYADVGLRAVIAPLTATRSFWKAIPGLYEALPPHLRAGVDALSPPDSISALVATRAALADWPFDRDMIRPALCPTIPYHCADDFIIGCRDLAEDFDLQVQTHVAESKVQAVVGQMRYGSSLLSHLARLGLVGPRFVAAHGVWLDDEDLHMLAGLGAALVHNPSSNLKLGAGIAPIAAARRAGVTLALGTDGSTCGDGLNMIEAMRLAALVSRVRSHDVANWLDAENVLAMATTGGAHALGFGGRLGRIVEGAAADLVLVSLDAPEFWPLTNALRQVVFLEGGRNVDRVIVNGRTIVQDGICISINRSALRQEVDDLMQRVLATRRSAGELTSALSPFVEQHCLSLACRPHSVCSLVCDDPTLSYV